MSPELKFKKWERIRKLTNNFTDFDELLQTLINRYELGKSEFHHLTSKPYILLELFEMAKEFGEPSDEYLDKFTTSFKSYKFLYNGYYFVFTFAQGTDLSIYNSGKENILCL
jgi:hypothetical protein